MVAAVASPFHIDVDMRGTDLAVTVCGAEGILGYSRDEVCIKLARGIASVQGDGLLLSVYENGCVEVVGPVKEVIFSDDRS